MSGIGTELSPDRSGSPYLNGVEYDAREKDQDEGTLRDAPTTMDGTKEAEKLKHGETPKDQTGGA
ncbi:MAG: hypothetical protein QM743_01920 [Chitinophagaceae bacterium]